MDLVGYVVMPIQKNGRSYLFMIPMGSPFEDAKEVCNEMLANVNQMEAQAAAAGEAGSEASQKKTNESEPITPEVVE